MKAFEHPQREPSAGFGLQELLARRAKGAAVDITDWTQHLKELGGRAWFSLLDEQPRKSDPRLLLPAEILAEFQGHEAAFLEVSPLTGVLMGAFLHRTVRGPGAGGVRFWRYQNSLDYLRDGLRLARAMSRKNALAGLWWGGGKGVMAYCPAQGDLHEPEFRRQVYREYGRFMSSLRGCYVTAEDAGTTAADMAHVFATTRFTTCIPTEVGGSGNPSGPTARGVLCAIEAALEFLESGPLEQARVAVQGLGNVGLRLVRLLREAGAQVVAADIEEKRCRQAAELGASLVDPEAILYQKCDLLAPCALGGILNDRSIPRLKTRLICGAANNQLEQVERHSEALHQAGITYVPDFLANRMGIVNCADEQYGSLSKDPRVLRHLDPDWPDGIRQTTLRVLGRARQAGVSPVSEANRQADQQSQQPHPIWGHRSWDIMTSLMNDGWRG